MRFNLSCFVPWAMQVFAVGYIICNMVWSWITNICAVPCFDHLYFKELSLQMLKPYCATMTILSHRMNICGVPNVCNTYHMHTAVCIMYWLYALVDQATWYTIKIDWNDPFCLCSTVVKLVHYMKIDMFNYMYLILIQRGKLRVVVSCGVV